MAQPFVGEIRLFAGTFAPVGWAMCAGQLMPISENDTLFNLIGTTYGGDGQETFQLPDLRGRVPIHRGTSFVQGEMAGTEDVTLTKDQTPAHTHAFLCTSDVASVTVPTNNVLASAPDVNTLPYGTDAPLTALNDQSIPPVGGSQPHENMQPFLCVNYIISLFGIFPSQT